MPLAEILDLDALSAECAADGVWSFLFVAPPLQPVRGRAALMPPGDIRAGSVLLAALIVVGAIAGAGWAAWSRTPTRGLIYTAHAWGGLMG